MGLFCVVFLTLRSFVLISMACLVEPQQRPRWMCAIISYKNIERNTLWCQNAGPRLFFGNQELMVTLPPSLTN